MANEIGALIIDIAGKTLTSADKEILKHPLVGGIIFFARNYDSPHQLKALCNSIRQSCSHPLLIMVDQEGGRVQRFINGFTRLPSMAHYGDLYANNPQKALKSAKKAGALMASEVLAVGVDFSLAPVIDLNKNLNAAIGDRAFHADPQTVIALAQAFCEGMQSVGMTSVAKHFPGHGSVSLDSHLGIPIDERSWEQIVTDDLLPFSYFIEHGIKAILAAHIIFPRVDQYPVGYSAIWLKQILRRQLGFTGVVFSDDLNMEGGNISARFDERFLKAREAGCDFTLVCNNRQGVEQILSNVDFSSHQINKSRWHSLQGDFSCINKPLQVVD